MKHIYLILLFTLLTSVSAFSQNAYTLSTSLSSTTDMVTPTATDITEDTVEFFNSDEYALFFAPLLVINSGVDTVSLKVRRIPLSIVAGSSNFFCWDLCYGSGVSQSVGTVTIMPGDTTSVFSSHYDPAGNSGTSYIRYKFYNNADTTEFASVVIKYTAGTVGIEDEKAAISNVYPNPASSQITFDYTTGHGDGHIVITDLTGKIVRTSILPANSTKQTIDLSGLTEGVYIYSFYSNNKAIATKKFLINK